jgi:hypothetical protein
MRRASRCDSRLEVRLRTTTREFLTALDTPRRSSRALPPKNEDQPLLTQSRNWISDEKPVLSSDWLPQRLGQGTSGVVGY